MFEIHCEPMGGRPYLASVLSIVMICAACSSDDAPAEQSDGSVEDRDGAAEDHDSSVEDRDDATTEGAMTATVVECLDDSFENPGMIENPVVVAIPNDAGESGKPFGQTQGLDAYDYELEEFFFTGTDPAFTSRMLVKRPSDPSKFSGTVFLEWYNVSGTADYAVLWASSQDFLMREGHIHIGVSAQAVGAATLPMADPERYADINVPDDTISNRIFSEAATALRCQTEKILGEGRELKAIIAAGQSQSSGRLADYLANEHPTAQVIDGLLLHSGGEPMTNDPDIPVFVVFTQTEGNGSLEDGPNLVEWVAAGASHNDEKITQGGIELSDALDIPVSECAVPMNRFPSYRIWDSVLHHLHLWVREGIRPPVGQPFAMAGNQIALDEHGNARGGVRLPDIEVPIATYGTANAPADLLDVFGYLICGLGGSTEYFSEEKLLELYPTHEDYVDMYTEAADEAVDKGWLLPADRDLAVAEAEAAAIPN